MGLRLTSEVLHLEVLGAGLLARQGVVEHHLRLRFDPVVELPHGHVAEPLHVLAHLVVRLELQTALRRRGESRVSASALAPSGTGALSLRVAWTARLTLKLSSASRRLPWW